MLENLAEDGTPEALSIADAPGFALAVQWHAEWGLESDPVNGPSVASIRQGAGAARSLMRGGRCAASVEGCAIAQRTVAISLAQSWL